MDKKARIAARRARIEGTGADGPSASNPSGGAGAKHVRHGVRSVSTRRLDAAPFRVALAPRRLHVHASMFLVWNSRDCVETALGIVLRLAACACVRWTLLKLPREVPAALSELSHPTPPAMSNRSPKVPRKCRSPWRHWMPRR